MGIGLGCKLQFVPEFCASRFLRHLPTFRYTPEKYFRPVGRRTGVRWATVMESEQKGSWEVLHT